MVSKGFGAYEAHLGEQAWDLPPYHCISEHATLQSDYGHQSLAMDRIMQPSMEADTTV